MAEPNDLEEDAKKVESSESPESAVSEGDEISQEVEESQESQDPQDSNNSRKKVALIVVIVMCVIIAISGISYIAYSMWHDQQVAQQQAETEVPEVVEETVVLPDNPIDFAALSSENPEIYAWIYIPNTYVNLPVLRSQTDDLYYMTHNRSGESAVEGAIFSQSMNSMDFTDPVTVLYGHNMVNNGMFASLHFFEDADFFNENSVCYVYVRGKILTYQIIAANQYDNRHIMNSFDFSNLSVRAEYFASLLAPTSLVRNVREGATLMTDDKVLQLSTCIGGTFSTQRYIVTCKLVSVQDTK